MYGLMRRRQRQPHDHVYGVPFPLVHPHTVLCSYTPGCGKTNHSKRKEALITHKPPYNKGNGGSKGGEAHCHRQHQQARFGPESRIWGGAGVWVAYPEEPMRCTWPESAWRSVSESRARKTRNTGARLPAPGRSSPSLPPKCLSVPKRFSPCSGWIGQRSNRAQLAVLSPTIGLPVKFKHCVFEYC